MLTSTMSVNDDDNPHHPNNQFHAYEYIEALLRCSARYCTEKHLKRKGQSTKGRGRQQKKKALVQTSSQHMHGDYTRSLPQLSSCGAISERLRRRSQVIYGRSLRSSPVSAYTQALCTVAGL